MADAERDVDPGLAHVSDERGRFSDILDIKDVL